MKYAINKIAIQRYKENIKVRYFCGKSGQADKTERQTFDFK